MYRNVGLFKYYEISQIPNFLLASPMIAISVYGIIEYIIHDPIRFVSIGFCLNTRNDKWYLNHKHLPFMYLWTFMLIYTLMIAHVQIITRLFIFIPSIYWLSARCYLYKRKIGNAILYYFILYGIVYTVLFSLFYPPA